MTTAVIIPSRYGSTRFEGKPLAPIAGKSMIQWVYEAARKADGIDLVAVATDDDRIADAVTAFGGRAIMTGASARSGTDRASEAAEILGLSDDDLIVNVQGDQPLIDARSIAQVISCFREEPHLDMSTLAFKIVNPREIDDPKDVKVVWDKRGNALYFSRSPIPLGRDAGSVYDTYKHLGVYAYPFRFLKRFASLPEGRLEGIEKLEQLRALEHGHAIRVIVTPHDSPEVDLPEDIPRIEAALAQRTVADQRDMKSRSRIS